MKKGHRLAFDYGDTRIGIAMSDFEGLLAFPLKVIRNLPNVFDREISPLIAEYSPIEIYIGLPLHLSGVEGESAKKAKKFGDEISERFHVKVSFIDERMSTITASQKLRESGKNSRESRKLIDAAAAVEILKLGLAHEG